MKTLEIQATEFENASLAIQHVNASGFGQAVSCDGKYLAIDDSESRRLETVGIRFAYLSEIVTPDGSFRIVTVPVND